MVLCEQARVRANAHASRPIQSSPVQSSLVSSRLTARTHARTDAPWPAAAAEMGTVEADPERSPCRGTRSDTDTNIYEQERNRSWKDACHFGLGRMRQHACVCLCLRTLPDDAASRRKAPGAKEASRLNTSCRDTRWAGEWGGWFSGLHPVLNLHTRETRSAGNVSVSVLVWVGSQRSMRACSCPRCLNLHTHAAPRHATHLEECLGGDGALPADGAGHLVCWRDSSNNKTHARIGR